MNRATELEWLRWFYMEADFGPADGQVMAYMKGRFIEETGLLLPLGYTGESDE